MSTFSYLAPRAAAELEAHVFRAFGDYYPLVAQRLVAEDRCQTAIAYAERARLLREAGIQMVGIAARLASWRAMAGTALIWIGEHLHGQPAVGPAASSAVSTG